MARAVAAAARLAASRARRAVRQVTLRLVRLGRRVEGIRLQAMPHTVAGRISYGCSARARLLLPEGGGHEALVEEGAVHVAPLETLGSGVAVGLDLGLGLGLALARTLP